MLPRELRQRAQERGFLTHYTTWDKKRKSADAGALEACLAAMPGAENSVAQPVAVVWQGHGGELKLTLKKASRFQVSIVCENGEQVSFESAKVRDALPLPKNLPLGVHRLKTTDFEAWVICAPMKAPTLPKNQFGLFLPLYSAHSRKNPGLGDYKDLYELSEWSKSQGAYCFGTLPLLAQFQGKPSLDVSPYAPITRLFWNEAFVHLGKTKRPRGDYVDYPTILEQKRRALGGMPKPRVPSEWKDFLLFVCWSEMLGQPWQHWPKRLPKVDPKLYNLHANAQLLAHEQMAGMGEMLYLDFPLGVHASGYDTWKYQDLFVQGFEVGAPPDEFFTTGQAWGFPPLNPHQLRATGYSYLRECLRFQMEHCRVLRIDHVLGLIRMFLIPEGFSSAHGVYLRYPSEEMAAIITLEAHLNDTAVVGENLGVVPPAINTLMKKHGWYGMQVLQFEMPSGRRAPQPPKAHNLACINTHDTPTLEGFKRGEDLNLRPDLTRSQIAQEKKKRRVTLSRLSNHLGTRGMGKTQPLNSVRFLAQSASPLTLFSLEDFWKEHRPQNTPGTGPELPNWLRRSKFSIEEIKKHPKVLQGIKAITKYRGNRHGSLSL